MLRARIVHDPPLDITWVSLYKVYVQFLHRTEMERQQKEAADRLEKARYALVRGRLHGELSTPGLNSALLTGLKFFAITWTISTPGLKRYTIRSRHRFPEVKKAFILFSCNK
jgi:hypothetical protein